MAKSPLGENNAHLTRALFWKRHRRRSADYRTPLFLCATRSYQTPNREALICEALASIAIRQQHSFRQTPRLNDPKDTAILASDSCVQLVISLQRRERGD